ncbi:MAG: sigma-70 family RNA polymerase sigma factor [Clostridia bacterium]|nr:sigma-70 family RNA polymerase sigma factor [Clostridia bacterium]
MKRDCENLFFDNFNLVYHILKKLNYNKNDQDDLVQEGAIGLLKAINSFDDKKGIRFSTYAFSCIKNEMLYYLRKNHYNYIYLNDYICDDIELIETIKSYDNDILEELIKNEMIESLKQYFNNKLNKIEQFIIKSLFGIECEKKNQGEVATILNVSQGSVSKEKKRLLMNLNNNLST